MDRARDFRAAISRLPLNFLFLGASLLPGEGTLRTLSGRRQYTEKAQMTSNFIHQTRRSASLNQPEKQNKYAPISRQL